MARSKRTYLVECINPGSCWLLVQGVNCAFRICHLLSSCPPGLMLTPFGYSRYWFLGFPSGCNLPPLSFFIKHRYPGALFRCKTRGVRKDGPREAGVNKRGMHHEGFCSSVVKCLAVVETHCQKVDNNLTLLGDKRKGTRVKQCVEVLSQTETVADIRCPVRGCEGAVEIVEVHFISVKLEDVSGEDAFV